jgi:hypothetical protein
MAGPPMSCAYPRETIGWSPDRTASKLAGRPPRLEVGDRVRLHDLDLVGYVVERAGPLVAVGWLNAGHPDAPPPFLVPDELVRTVWQVAPAPLRWPLIPEVVTS